MMHGGGRSGGSGNGTGSNEIELMLPDSYHCAKLPAHLVQHPQPCAHGLVLCRNYQAGDPRSCPRGSQCRFVHVDLDATGLHDAAARSTCHINYLWRHEELAIYPRLSPGDTLMVYGPNMREPVEMLPSHLIFATRGSVVRSETGKHSHCAHFYFNRLCLRGADCNFVHVVSVDPGAGDFQRAPVVHIPPTANTANRHGGGSTPGSRHGSRSNNDAYRIGGPSRARGAAARAQTSSASSCGGHAEQGGRGAVYEGLPQAPPPPPFESHERQSYFTYSSPLLPPPAAMSHYYNSYADEMIDAARQQQQQQQHMDQVSVADGESTPHNFTAGEDGDDHEDVAGEFISIAQVDGDDDDGADPLGSHGGSRQAVRAFTGSGSSNSSAARMAGGYRAGSPQAGSQTASTGSLSNVHGGPHGGFPPPPYGAAAAAAVRGGGTCGTSPVNAALQSMGSNSSNRYVIDPYNPVTSIQFV